MTKQSITILGATGSIGISTLEVLSLNPEQFNVFALTANCQWQKLLVLIKQFKPQVAVCFDEESAACLNDAVVQLNLDTLILSGAEGLNQVAAEPAVDTVIAAIVGSAGLLPTLSAVKAGKKIMLANKEALVMAGDFFIQQVKKYNALLLPVDSEHNALFQCLPNHLYGKNEQIDWHQLGVEKLILTASGGPFLNTPLTELENITPVQACAHPNWKMGKKISVDSATLMNKGLEVIEASYLYGISAADIDVVIHPQSIVHSMVSYLDGSVLAELGNPDMRTPIAHVLAWPKRIKSGVAPLDFMKNNQLDFQTPDLDKFPCLALAFAALQTGGTAPAVINAANEIAVAAFLHGQLSFLGIAKIIESTLNEATISAADNLQRILKADHQAREIASSNIKKWHKNHRFSSGRDEIV